jgi:hypothetical protein
MNAEDSDSATQPSSPASTKAPPRGKARAIDYAVEQLGIESFASVEIADPYGQWAFYTIDKPTVQHGALVDFRPRRTRRHLLSAIELAAERPGMRVLDRPFSNPRTVAEIGQVDAVLLFDVLIHMVDPASCFVIGNPQWARGESTVRLIELGRDGYLEAVPPRRAHTELFDRLEEWHPGHGRPYRDTTGVWQWGITDAGLEAKLDELGFSLEREWTLNAPRETAGFVNKAFVFSRRTAQP